MSNALKLLAAGSIAMLVAVVSIATSIGMNHVTSVSAASDYFLKLDGVANTIEINSWSWGVSNIATPRDSASGQATGKRESASGQATGKRQHKPFVIVKELDRSSPILFKALGDGTRYKQVTLTRGSYTVTFFDVFISEFQHEGTAGSDPTESVSFTYQKIEMK